MAVPKSGSRKTAAKKKPVKSAAGKKVAVSPAVAELDQRIALIRNNLRDLTEVAAASSGASNEELVSGRIAEQEEKLRALTKQREDLVGGKG